MRLKIVSIISSKSCRKLQSRGGRMEDLENSQFLMAYEKAISRKIQNVSRKMKIRNIKNWEIPVDEGVRFTQTFDVSDFKDEKDK